MPFTKKDSRDTGYSGAVGYLEETSLRLLCAFNGIDPNISPPGWWAAPNNSSRKAWERVANEARVDRETAIRCAADIARNGCLVLPDGGSPTQAEADMCDDIATAILRLI